MISVYDSPFGIVYPLDTSLSCKTAPRQLVKAPESEGSVYR